ncbi:hypothetical protein QB607_002863 [Clostridium botulinum]|nr:hypothetical protein [Clostridium botulinum]EKS4395339.1 hypothetical protein [Clostridium botulinum]
MKRNIVYAVTITFLISILSIFLNVSIIKEHHFDLITVNSIFSGFLFTSLTILLGFNDEEIIELLEKGDYLDSIYKNITQGLTFSIISIIISILNLAIFESYNHFLKVLKYLYSAEMFFLIVTVVKFIFAIIDLSFLINSIRDYRKKKIKENAANKQLDKKFNKNNC